MKLKLFWKIYLSIAITCIGLVTGLSYLSEYVEDKMSHLTLTDQQTLKEYARQATELAQTNPELLTQWAEDIAQREQTWLVVVKAKHQWLYGSEIPAALQEETVQGRLVEWPIHLEHEVNPVMDLPLNFNDYHLLIQLPQHMRPGAYWQVIHLLITVLLPLLLTAIISYLMYRNIIKPLQALHRDSAHFTQGDFNTRSSSEVSNRNDEIGELATGFNDMADNISALIKSQRQLIADISHELRTPITRLKLLLSSGYNKADVIERFDRELGYMAGLVEDTLTLAWLNNEKPDLSREDVDLTALIETIAEDARFEFTQHQLVLQLPESCQIENSNHRALGQSIENVVRNSMKYSPEQSQVSIKCWQEAELVTIEISDQGAGVPVERLEDMFEPFVRLDQARDRASGGYGLGLALTKRQITALGGTISASANTPHGLVMTMTLPIK
ncbi:histidine kinase sensor domain-containing protein [Psychrobium sp. MM17-31]|uniref:ATP-binding protein n=1 Tax=Psychrobium sp. MM17-31 TaxID=2917758 RepID=UPI001EF64106|nr:ATP-binding protein [Psychrobium sp. MM17-31]MCG7532650.1 histidine kinase sensor domain-containing protein [Psychrobium sp. MM17-31]